MYRNQSPGRRFNDTFADSSALDYNTGAQNMMRNGNGLELIQE